VLTCPDNPTGTLAGADTVAEVCRIADSFGLAVVSDEIYRDLRHDPAAGFRSAAELLPDRTVVSTGLSKTLGLGGWRIGALRLPPGPWGRHLQARVTAIASDLWSGLAGPLQAAGAYAFAEPADVRDRVRAAARMHGALARAVHRLVVARGASARPPTAGFYVYPDLERHRAALLARGVRDAAGLQRLLLDRYGIAVLGGHHLGDHPHLLRFKIATSLLCGDSAAEQELTLLAPDPTTLPHVRSALGRLAGALDDLAGRPPAPAG
jgi:aspartate aminotransferase